MIDHALDKYINDVFVARPLSAIFRSAEELAAVAKQWPATRMVEVWNKLPGGKPVRKFTDRQTGVRRLWEAVQGVAANDGKQRSKAGSKRQAAAQTGGGQGRTARKSTKTERVLALLRQPSGATLAALMRATQWQAHSVRGFISGQLGKRMGLRVKSFRRAGDRVYRLLG